ncbi:MAG: DUF5667 domain-containing protein [Patescibacteria group bacterium]
MARDFLGELKSLKSNRKAGWVSFAEKQANRARLMTAIENSNITVSEKTSTYSFWWMRNFISMPATIAASVFVMAIGGWVGTVGAASNSVPGDTLYSVKMITEMAQLRFSSSEEKAVLHTEFAEKRLAEATVLVSRGESSEPAITAFKSEMALASDELRQLQDYGSTETLAIASQVNDKINEMNSTIDSQATASQEEVTIATKETANTVVDVVVEEHEIEVKEQSKSDLNKMFREEYTDMKGREAFDLGRVEVIAGVIATNELEIIFDVNITSFQITQATAKVADAMSLAAAGGYRSAFDILRTADATLLTLESNLAAVEEQVMQAMQEKANAPVVESQAPTQDPILEEPCLENCTTEVTE